MTPEEEGSGHDRGARDDERDYKHKEWEHEQHRPEASELEAAWGGINLSVKGTMVVLALLILFGTGIIVWTLGQQNTHFDAILASMERRLDRHSQEMGELRASFGEQHHQQVNEIGTNRLYLREIQRVCMLTPAQRERLQQSLSPTMKELLFRGESPLESIERQQRGEH